VAPAPAPNAPAEVPIQSNSPFSDVSLKESQNRTKSEEKNLVLTEYVDEASETKRLQQFVQNNIRSSEETISPSHSPEVDAGAISPLLLPKSIIAPIEPNAVVNKPQEVDAGAVSPLLLPKSIISPIEPNAVIKPQNSLYSANESLVEIPLKQVVQVKAKDLPLHRHRSNTISNFGISPESATASSIPIRGAATTRIVRTRTQSVSNLSGSPMPVRRVLNFAPTNGRSISVSPMNSPMSVHKPMSRVMRPNVVYTTSCFQILCCLTRNQKMFERINV